MPLDDDSLHGTSGRMSPFDELELADLQAAHAALDEERTMFDPGTHPKPPGPKEEGVTDRDGTRPVDMMADTPAVDFLGTFDLSERDLRDVDIEGL